MENATDAAARFQGHWRLDRHIHDFDAGWTGRLIGWASFSPVPGALAYAEAGELTLGGLTLRASRTYRWSFPAPDRVEIAFDDGRFFHAFDPRADVSVATHHCDPDRYDVTYHLADPHHWRAEWRVEGPRKDYRLVTHYRREG